MSSPENMRTGINIGSTPQNVFPEVFFIIYMILSAILRRCGFKDSILYAEHNNMSFDYDLFDSGVLFNLLSEYGVGKSLEPLIKEFLSTMMLDPFKNEGNIFFQEVARLTGIVSKVIRSHDPTLEAEWAFNYAITMTPVIDDIALERIDRLQPLLKRSPSEKEYTFRDRSPESSESSYIESESDDMDYEIELDTDTEEMDYDGDIDPEYYVGPELEEYNMEFDSALEIESESTEEVDTETDSEIVSCECNFCNEFRKYHQPTPDRDIGSIINNVLTEISKKVNVVY